MKLNRKQINVRLPERLLEKMKIIQTYKSRTATIIIEDALEKGLAWYLKQAGAELGYTKEKPLTWEQLAALVKLSVSPKKDDKPEQQAKEENEKSTYEFEYECFQAIKEVYPEECQNFKEYLTQRVKENKLTQEEAQQCWNEYVRNS